MHDVSLDPRVVRIPEFAAGTWLNTNKPLNKGSLRKRITLIDFWDYACVNCTRTLPYLNHWYQRYADKGLTIIGVHTPEFQFAQLKAHVETAVSRHQLRYPILLDNDYENWSRFANKAWPTKYVVDGDGYIRLQRQGEGYYWEVERAIQILLRQQDARVVLPEPLPALRQEDRPGAVCFRPTPELYAGYQGGGLFGGALGNSEGYVPQNPMFYELPEARGEGQFFVEGVWRAWPESLAYAGQQGGKIVLTYRSAEVIVVLSPTADMVELALDLRPSQADPVVLVKQDGRFLDDLSAGEDVLFRRDGTSYVRVTRPRMYHLVRNGTHRTHELELTFCASGLSLYAFTFTACLAPSGLVGDAQTYQVR
jgi:thiol-disulfide isomerase/thioredoxin